jgi:hypothetical protein
MRERRQRRSLALSRAAPRVQAMLGRYEGA